MSPIDQNEISALLDGELSKEREEQVLHAIAEDPSLQREYELLAGLHTAWLTSARDAGFRPDISIPPVRLAVPVSVPLLASALVLLRVMAKTLPPITACSMEVIVLVLILTWLLRTLIPACDPLSRKLA